MTKYILFASGGNDSVALVAYAKRQMLKNVTVSYSNTGWASPSWPKRIAAFRSYVESIGYSFVEVMSDGFEELVRRKKGFPANKPKFCTYELKIRPAMQWMEIFDPRAEAVCMVGVRREESNARSNWPLWSYDDEAHGGRDLWSPLAGYTAAERDLLVGDTPMPILPHRSRECSPCVNSNRADFRMLPVSDIEKVMALESEIGKPMFRAARFMGANGINEVMRWAWSEHGKFLPEVEDCDSGFCGG